MFGRRNPLKEVDGEEYKMAREEGFARGRRTGWAVSALIGIPAVAIAAIATWGALAMLLFVPAAIAGSLVVGAVFQMQAERKASKETAYLLMEHREHVETQMGKSPEQEQDKAQEAANAPANDGKAAPQQGNLHKGSIPPAHPSTVPQASASYHGVATSPQVERGTVVGPNTANAMNRGAPAMAGRA